MGWIFPGSQLELEGFIWTWSDKIINTLQYQFSCILFIFIHSFYRFLVGKSTFSRQSSGQSGSRFGEDEGPATSVAVSSPAITTYSVLGPGLYYFTYYNF